MKGPIHKSCVVFAWNNRFVFAVKAFVSEIEK